MPQDVYFDIFDVPKKIRLAKFGLFLLRRFVLIRFRAEFALSTLALVAGCRSNSLKIVAILGNKFAFISSKVATTELGLLCLFSHSLFQSLTS